MSKVSFSFLELVTLLFALFILSIILLADTGQLPGVLHFVHDIPYGDKIGHFLLIGILSFLTNSTALRCFPRKPPRRVVALTCLALALFFGLEEASQILIPARRASFLDLLAGLAGITFFGWLACKRPLQRAPSM